MSPMSSEATLHMRDQTAPTALSDPYRRPPKRSEFASGYQLFTMERAACTPDRNAESSIASSWQGAALRFRATSSVVSPAIGFDLDLKSISFIFWTPAL